MIRKLLYLNGIAALGVILNHAIGWTFVGMFFWTDQYAAVTVPNFDALGSPQYYVLRFIEQLIGFAITAFVFVSGYFTSVAAGRNADAPSWKVIGSRFRNLAIPYVIWSLVYMAYNWWNGEPYTLISAVQTLLFGRADDLFYFVPMILQLYALSVLIGPLARRRPIVLLIIAAALQGLVVFSRYGEILNWQGDAIQTIFWLTPNWLFTTQIFFYSLGMIYGFHQNKLRDIVQPWRVGLLIALVVLLIGGIVEWEWLLGMSGQSWIGPRETLVDHLFAVTLLLTMIGYQDNLINPLSKQIGDLGVRSYGIYLTHALIMELTARGIYNLFPALFTVPLASLLLLSAIGLAIPLLMMTFVNRTPLQRIYGLLFG